MQFELKDAKDLSPYIFHMNFKEGTGSIQEGRASNPQLTVIVSHENFLRLVAGTLSTQDAYMKGLVKVKGNMGLAMQLEFLMKHLRKVAQFDSKL